jgi:hypothetical protein
MALEDGLMHSPAALLHPRELTPRWLTAALDRGGIRAEVAGFRWKRIGQDTGIGGFVTRVELRYRVTPPADAPASVVIKFPRWRGADAVPYAVTERRFYVDHAHACPIASPRLYVAALNRRARLWSLVLEDLSPHRALDDVVGIPADDAPVVVESLALLHAWGRRQASLHWIPLAYDETAQRRSWYERNVERGIRRLRGFIPSPDLARLRGLSEYETAARIMLAAEPLTPSHQDFRADNLFMTVDRRPMAIDWESLWRYRGGAELGRLLATSLRSEHLASDGPALTDLYARTVHEQGFIEYGRDEIERDVRLGFLRLMIRSVAQMPSPALGRGRPLRVVRTWAIRSCAAVRRFDAFDAVPGEALRAAAEPMRPAMTS